MDTMQTQAGSVIDNLTRKARPDRIRVSLGDAAAAGATRLELPDRRMWPVGLIVAFMFVIFTGVEWTVIAGLARNSVRNVFDLMLLLFQGFWVLGWSVGVVFLGGLTVLLFFYRESALLQDGRLVYVPRLGPLKIIIEYDLARVRHVRVENVNAGTDNKVRVRFDYDQGTIGLGDAMPRSEGEQLVKTIQNAAGPAGLAVETAPVAPARQPPRPEPAVTPPQALEAPPPSLTSLSGLALIGANLIPLIGVLFFGWDLASVIVLFWAESGVIGFYTVLKMAIVGKLAALFAVPFFVAHFGGFMAGHFLFIYTLFVRGLNPAGPEPGVREALLRVFMPIWPSLAALFISHEVSFFSNFLGRREHAGTTMKALMTAPYNRIMVMQFVIILGGWIIMLLKNPVPVLALLVLLKTALDFRAHRKEHGSKGSAVAD
jgi:hypothetical protein